MNSGDDIAPPRECELEGHRTFVIGDIHGCADELNLLLHHIEEKEGLAPEDVVIFIGDYIDRGPDSKGVIDLLLDFDERQKSDVYFLKGNHEEMLLGYLELGGSGGDVYLINGGKEFLASYGLGAKVKPSEALEAIPERHIQFFQNLTRYLVSEQFIFAHAGLNPLRDLGHQIDDDLFWIRDEFIQNVHYFRKTVVFGHTPFEDVMFHLPFKIGIDTGLVYGNALTAIELSGERIYQIEPQSVEIEEFSFKEKGGIWPKIG
ncbi:MAG: serine/threonine protein phosphatase [Bdellovibrionales bacterium]|nr:serine/threonine protein phosphatase [Bdellovibrionales bacterium]